jgi:predicted phage-related endonuclease
MFKININSKTQGQFWLEKTTQAEVDEYLKWAKESAHWGKPAWIEEVPEKIELEIVDGVQVQKTTPAYQIVHPAEYTITVEDMTAQVAAEQAQIDAVKAAQQQAGMRLMLFPQQVDDCHDLDSLKETIKLMVSDIAVLLVK